VADALGHLVFRPHAIQRMFERRISRSQVRRALEEGQVIEDYQDDMPYPSRLVLYWNESVPLHVVAARNQEEGETIVITVYEPDPQKWDSDFRRRRKP